MFITAGCDYVLLAVPRLASPIYFFNSSQPQCVFFHGRYKLTIRSPFPFSASLLFYFRSRVYLFSPTHLFLVFFLFVVATARHYVSAAHDIVAPRRRPRRHFFLKTESCSPKLFDLSSGFEKQFHVLPVVIIAIADLLALLVIMPCWLAFGILVRCISDPAGHDIMAFLGFPHSCTVHFFPSNRFEMHALRTTPFFHFPFLSFGNFVGFPCFVSI